MKISALITALALAGGVAAAQANTSAAYDAPTKHPATTAAADDTQHEGLGTKLKNGLHRMGQAMRRMTHKDKTTDTAAANDTRAMGSYGTSEADHTRKQRMDQAYDDYKTKQK